jgi:hypothetical protein
LQFSSSGGANFALASVSAPKAGRDKNQNEMSGLQGEFPRAFVRFRFKPASTRRP